MQKWIDYCPVPKTLVIMPVQRNMFGKVIWNITARDSYPIVGQSVTINFPCIKRVQLNAVCVQLVEYTRVTRRWYAEYEDTVLVSKEEVHLRSYVEMLLNGETR